MTRRDIKPTRTKIHKHPYLQYYADDKEAHDFNSDADNISDSYQIPTATNTFPDTYAMTDLGNFSSDQYADLATESKGDNDRSASSYTSSNNLYEEIPSQRWK